MSTDGVIEHVLLIMQNYGNGVDGLNAVGQREELAKALAEAGLLARPMDKIALDRLQELAEARGYNRGFHLGWDSALDFMRGKNQ